MKYAKKLFPTIIFYVIVFTFFNNNLLAQDEIKLPPNVIDPFSHSIIPSDNDVAINPGDPNLLEIHVSEQGKMQVFGLVNSKRIEYVVNDDWGPCMLNIDGDNSHTMHGNGSVGYHYPPLNAYTPISNIFSGSGTGTDPYVITTVLGVGSTGIELTQTITYINGRDNFDINVRFEHNGTETYEDVRFFYGGFSNYDEIPIGTGHWYEDSNSVAISYGYYSNLLQASANPPTAYEASGFNDVYCHVLDCELQNLAIEDRYYPGMFLQWNRNTFSPGNTWSLDLKEIHNGAKWDIDYPDYFAFCEIGMDTILYFTLSNNDEVHLDFDLTAQMLYSCDWGVTLQNGSSYSLDPGEETSLPIVMSIPADTQFGSLGHGEIMGEASDLSTRLSYNYVYAYEPFYEMSSESLDFGSVTIGQTADLILTMTNIWDEEIDLGELFCGDSGTYTVLDDPTFETIPVGGSRTITIRFSPVESTTYDEELNWGVYRPLSKPAKIPMSGIGDATSLNIPSTQASNISFDGIEPLDLDISWTNGNGQYRAVFLKQGTGSLPDPGNTVYSSSADWNAKGDQVGTSGFYCIGNLTGNSVSITNLEPNTQYTLAVLEFNGSLVYANYNTTDNSSSVNTSTLFSGGDGSSGSPFLVANLDDLRFLSEHSDYWGYNYKQTSDLIFAGSEFTSGGDFYNDGNGFIPIGNSDFPFTGSYNGQNYTINGLTINRDTDENGLFGFVDDTEISNINITNANITCTNTFSRSAVLIGITKGNTVVTNCHVSGNISGNNYLGGLIATDYMNGDHLTLTNCSASVNLSTITYSSLNGGIFGVLKFDADINNCLSNSDLTVSGDNAFKTGVFGGEINGYWGATINIENCYALGSSSDESSGGFLGHLDIHSSNITINKSFNSNNRKFIASQENGFATYSKNFYNSELSGASSSVGAEPAITSEMQDIRLYGYSAYDFMNETVQGSDDDWGYNPAQNSGYPFLSWQNFSHDYSYPPTFVTPPTQAYSISGTNLERYSFTVNWTNGSGDRRVVFMKEGDGAITNPVNYTSYTASSDWSAKGEQLGTLGYYCIYNGRHNSVDVTGLNIDTSYKVYVFSYNGYPGQELFNTNTATDNPNTIQTSLPFISGDGSSGNPYEISQLADLQYLSENSLYWSDHFFQSADIDASDTQNWNSGAGFSAIGNNTTNFTGSYDGNEYSISNLTSTTGDYTGLFGYINSSYEIKDLTLTDVSISTDATGNSYLGGIALLPLSRQKMLLYKLTFR